MLQVSLLDTESKKKLRWIQCKCFCFKFSDFREVIDVYSTSDQPYPSFEYIGKKEKKSKAPAEKNLKMTMSSVPEENYLRAEGT